MHLLKKGNKKTWHQQNGPFYTEELLLASQLLGKICIMLQQNVQYVVVKILFMASQPIIAQSILSEI